MVIPFVTMVIKYDMQILGNAQQVQVTCQLKCLTIFIRRRVNECLCVNVCVYSVGWYLAFNVCM